MISPDPARPLGLGLLGASAIGATVAADLAHVEGLRLVAVGSRDAERSRAYAERVGNDGPVRAHGSYEQLLADPDVDVVYVGTTHEAHGEPARLAVEAGKAVLVEKPCTVVATDSAELFALARARGVFAMEAMWTRTLPAVRELVGLVSAGGIGEVVHVEAAFANRTAYDPGSRLFDPSRAGGALLDLGVYPLTFARLLLGAPSRVRASARLRGGVDLTTQVLLDHPGGATAAVGCSMETALPHVGRVFGTEGWIEVRDPAHPDGFVVHRPDRPSEERSAPRTGTGYAHELAEVVRCVRAGLLESPLVPHAETVGLLETCDEVRRQVGLRYPFEG